MTIKNSEWEHLIAIACASAKNSTSLNHVVGAAILDSSGQIHRGANFPVDNERSTLHAEDVAVSSMLSSNRTLKIRALATVAFDFNPDGLPTDLYFTYPCGSCRNLISQYTSYGTPEEALIYWDTSTKPKSISEIYPIGKDSIAVPLVWTDLI